MGVTGAIDITPNQRKTILGLLKRYLPNVTLWAYGSRVKWTSRPQSDMDMVAFVSPDQKRLVSDLNEAFEESDLPFRVDLFIWDEVPEEFRKNIEAEHVVLQERQEQGVGNEWPEVPLSQLYDFRSGLSKPRSEFGYGFLSFKDVFYNYFVPDKFSELVNSTERERESCSIKRGDVFLTRTSETMEELGMSCVALKDYENATFNGFTKRLRPNGSTKIVPEYAGYFFRSPKFRREVTAMSSLSPRASLNNEMLGRLKVILPSIEVQEAIGFILKSLDDKIELNRQMNRTLERMAQAIFKSWFIDFDPVRAKAEGRNPGLPKEIADLFPDSFEDSELGEIPKGWEVKPIGDVVRCVGGATPSTKKPQYWDGATNPFLTPKDMSSLSCPVILDTERHITDAGVEKISSKQLPIGTVILSSRAPIGYLTINEVPVSVNQGVIAMICDGVLPNHYVLQWTKENMKVIKGKAGGATFAEISKKNFRSIPALVPDPKILELFTDQIEPTYQQIVENVVSSQALARTRDILLPKLISGELPIPDAEKLLEGVR